MYCGFPTVSDKDFDRVKQESRGPIIGRCPLSLAGKLEYVRLSPPPLFYVAHRGERLWTKGRFNAFKKKNPG
jgi:hypothetical protein